jgi:valyl-tRNA synthetase
VLGELSRLARNVADALGEYRFNEAASALYEFTWGTFCDWYLEFTKPVLAGGDDAAKAETRAVTAFVLRELLKLMHPFMPFVTEELWGEFRFGAGLLVLESWPDLSRLPDDAAAGGEMSWVVRLIETVRRVRAELNVPPGARVRLGMRGAGEAAKPRLERHRELILRLARLETAEIDEAAPPSGAVQAVHDEATLVLPLAGVVDLAKERDRLQKELAKAEKEIAQIDRKLANADFVARAPEEVVEEQRERREEYAGARATLSAALERLSAA